MPQNRRVFLRHTAAASILATPALNLLWKSEARAADYGPLLRDPDGLLELPEGFSYRILQRQGDEMSDGYVVPEKADGMACFAGPNNTLVLMRNHENNDDGGAYRRGDAPDEAYTDNNMGGVTRVVVDADTLEVLSSNLVLTGTVRNCAGGLSPFGWLTCEEPGIGLFNTNHGFVFLCDDQAESLQEPVRIDGYGRFNHEAAVIDADTMIAYLTEDEGDGCFYRFVPTDPAQPFLGQLQALKVVDEDQADTSNRRQVGDTFAIEWVDIDEPVPGAFGATRREGRDKGAARFKRGEGLWLYEGAVYFSCTTGGPGDSGQIFKLTPDGDGAGDGGELELIAQPDDTSVMNMPDNICVAPWGDVYVAEDPNSGNPMIRVVTTAGEIFDFARNARNNDEIAGACFSPDGQTLFFNFQGGSGITFAVTGPFPQVEPPEEPPGGDGDGDGDTTGGDGDTTGDGGDGDTTGGDGDGDTTDGDGDTTGGGTDDEGNEPGGGDPTGGCAVGGGGNATGLAAAVVGVALSGAAASRRGGDESSADASSADDTLEADCDIDRD